MSEWCKAFPEVRGYVEIIIYDESGINYNS
jgi:hypothetical protein